MTRTSRITPAQVSLVSPPFKTNEPYHREREARVKNVRFRLDLFIAVSVIFTIICNLILSVCCVMDEIYLKENKNLNNPGKARKCKQYCVVEDKLEYRSRILTSPVTKPVELKRHILLFVL